MRSPALYTGIQPFSVIALKALRQAQRLNKENQTISNRYCQYWLHESLNKASLKDHARYGADGETRTRTALRHYPLKIACLPISPRRPIDGRIDNSPPGNNSRYLGISPAFDPVLPGIAGPVGCAGTAARTGTAGFVIDNRCCPCITPSVLF